ncbi:ASST-domain-containing protein, partial [Coniella lustricola]
QPPVFDINKTGTTADGYIFLDTNTNGAEAGNLVATIIDEDGQLIWSAVDTGTTNPSYQTYNGEDVIVHWSGQISGEIGRGYGQVVILDTSYNVVANVTLTEGIYAAGTIYDSYIDAHEALITTDNTLLVTVYNTTQADLTSVGWGSAGWILDSMVFELDIATSEVLWSWSAADHEDQIPFAASHEPIVEIPHFASTAWDYFHINAIAEYSEGYLISSRTLWNVYYVEKSTGNVVWYYNGGDGGNFTLPVGFEAEENTGTQLFKYQHDPRVLSTSSTGLVLTLFDNNNFEYGDLLTPNNSYGLEISLNTETWTSTLNQLLYDEANPVHTIAEGDRQTLASTGGVFIGYGFQPYAKEFDASGNVVWSANWGSLGDGAYRARKYTFEGTPTTLPKIAAEADGSEYTVYVSWNGATEVTEWELVGCGTAGTVTFDKSGFETSWT